MNNLYPCWAAYARLQKKYDSLRFINGSDFDIYDHAAGLSLEDQKSSLQYLAHNNFRHAKTTIIRRKNRTNKTYLASELYEENYLDSIESFGSNIEINMLNQELVLRLICFAQKLGGKMLICIKDWLMGYSATETSKKLGISTAAIMKMRQRFKQRAAKEVFG
ncbi:MAG: hypothetical protein HRT35_07555 [Algicola sp.]|nr:hypothetical protein [Algicola sp.]